MFKYRAILYLHEDNLKEITANKMCNPYGFEDSRWIKIISAKDSSVVELVDDKLVTRPEDPAREEFQTFQCILNDSGHYQIKCQHQDNDSEPMVWDYVSYRKLLLQKKLNKAATRSNQNWVSELVPGSDSCFFILSAPELNKCLKNEGVDNQIKIVPKSESIIGDKSAHWKLIMLEPLAAGQVSSNQPMVQATAGTSALSSPRRKKSSCSVL